MFFLYYFLNFEANIFNKLFLHNQKINNRFLLMAFSRGPNTLEVTAKLFIENRRRLVNALRKATESKSVIVLQGGVEKNRYNTDAEDLPFRQVIIFQF